MAGKRRGGSGWRQHTVWLIDYVPLCDIPLYFPALSLVVPPWEWWGVGAIVCGAGVLLGS